MKPANPDAPSRVAKPMATKAATKPATKAPTKAGTPRQSRAKTPQTFTVDGNRLHVLETGAARLKALIGLIDGARSSLRLLYYIYTADEVGRTVRDALERAIARKVTVKLIVDGFGSSAPPDFFAALEKDGADVCHFLPRYGRRYLLRNHQKLAIADEHQVLIGGFNIEDDYFDDGPAGWRDLGLCVEGPAAKRLVGYFDALAKWTHQEKSRLGDLRRALSRWSEPRGGPVRWLLGGPTRKLSPWAQTVRREMRGAHRLDMIAAYFAPNPMMLRRIEAIAKKRGGEARIMTAAKSDQNATIAAARHTYRRLLDRKVRLFEYQPTKLHTKLFVIDDVVHIGSANFDIRSLYLNLELMLRIEDKAFADHMRGYVAREYEDAREVTREEHAKAGWLDRLRWSLAYFLVAVVDANVTRRLNFGVEQNT
jgi:cardiolipin synthase